MSTDSANLGNQEVANEILIEMQGTKPWTQLFTILIVLGSLLMVVGGVAAAIMEPRTGIVTGIAYGIMAILYVFVARSLWNFTKGLKKTVDAPTSDNLVSAMTLQKNFWKLVGIMVIVGFILMVVLAIVLVFLTISSATSSL